jgi:EAL domain-containing protein (putative c-di-GMP-specific phosphodiesterase class I)
MNAPYEIVPENNPSSLAAIEALLDRDGNGRTTGRFHGHRLDSHFQPIYSLAHGRVIGWEALMRGTTPGGQPAMPPAILALPRDDRERSRLDCLSRAVHVDNFLGAGPTDGWLLLNVQPETFLQGPWEGTFFEDLFSSRNLPHHRVVLEVLEDAIRDRSQIGDAIEFYRNHGCLVAIDDFGAGHSNFDRVWSMRPDLVKLDRQMLLRATEEPRIRRVMPAMVSMLHEAGALVLMEGVETEEQALIALDADVDLAQGYLLGRPARSPMDAPDCTTLFEELWRRSQTDARAVWMGDRRHIAPYQNEIGLAATHIEAGISPEVACSRFLTLPRADRCYLLTETGRQTEHRMLAPDASGDGDARFGHLGNAAGANWSRRPYFRRAIEHPGRVQISRPYLSLATAKSCVTLSIQLRTRDGQLLVLCGDVAEA